jgi:hypothetical protein
MKTHLTMLLVLAAGSLGVAACAGAPTEEVASTAAPVTAEAEALHVNASEVRFLSEEEAQVEELKATSVRNCTPAELANCRRQDPFGSGCAIINGVVTCLFE